ncbi:MAG TPA: dihydrolipoyl dehydrogenase [Saprospiraceae bacterium]|nr:dihydrolipoyl dehydrogenase [Saprospirales bacterium]HRQ29091.1 dihydrolipoyl dehydrogenase [Saprospiraceae bacterium]
MDTKKYDIIVIGSGPGGYVASIRAAQLGFKVAIIEKESLGGICLNWGCIPTKALLKSAEVYNKMKHAADYGLIADQISFNFEAVIDRSRGVAEKMSKGIEFLMRKNNIEVIKGFGKLTGDKKVAVIHEGQTIHVEADHIIIATGARAKELPNIKIDNKKIISYRLALSSKKLPKKLVVVGAGAIGVEFAWFFNSFGTEVTIVEYMEQGLLPREDNEISKALARSFKKVGIKVMANSKVEEIRDNGEYSVVCIRNRKNEKLEEIDAEIVLSAAGISPNTEELGLLEAGITVKEGFIEVDDHYQTSVPGIYAIGDVINTPALAHVASAEGIHCVEFIKGMEVHAINYKNIPSNTYCSPEVASMGLTEEEAKAAGHELKIGKFPFSASGKASAAGDNDGFVKLIFDAKYGELLGAHMIGSNVTEMIAELILAKTGEVTAHEIIKSIHPHPTMSEAVMEAAAAAYDEVIHI